MYGQTLRELYSFEYMFYMNAKRGDLINPKTFIVETKFNIFNEIKTFKESILHWQKLHPCLNVHIKEVQNNNRTELYYVHAKEEKANSLDNVYFIRVKDNQKHSLELEDKYWKTIHEMALQKNLIAEKDLLWKLVVLQLTEFKYAFVFNILHAVTDGSNSFALMQELLNLYEKNRNGIVTETSIERNILSKYEYEYPNDPRCGERPKSFDPIPSVPLNFNFIPDFLKNQETNSSDENTEEFIYETIDGDCYANSKDLIEKNRKYNTGFITMRIDSQIFSRFVSVCKKSGVKLNCVFEQICCLAFRELYQQFGNNNIELDQIKYVVSINTRSYIPVQVPNYVMNAWTEMFENTDELHLSDKNEAFWTKFWESSKSKFIKLHNHISQLKNSQIYNADHFWNIVDDENWDLKLNGVLNYFALTNLGSQKSFIEDTQGEIRIKEYYTSNSFTPQCFYNALLLGTCSIDSYSYWSCSYNRSLIKDTAAQKIIDTIYEYVEQISTDGKIVTNRCN